MEVNSIPDGVPKTEPVQDPELLKYDLAIHDIGNSIPMLKMYRFWYEGYHNNERLSVLADKAVDATLPYIESIESAIKAPSRLDLEEALTVINNNRKLLKLPLLEQDENTSLPQLALSEIQNYSKLIFNNILELEKKYEFSQDKSYKGFRGRINEFMASVDDIPYIMNPQEKITLENCNLWQLVDEALAEIKQTGYDLQHPIRLISNPETEEMEIVTNRELFKKVLKNIALNAVKYSFQDDKQPVNIYLNPNSISIQDFGIGLTLEQVEILNQHPDKIRFENAKEHARGNGVGYKLSTILGEGKLGLSNFRVESKGPKKGSTFSFDLP